MITLLLACNNPSPPAHVHTADEIAAIVSAFDEEAAPALLLVRDSSKPEDSWKRAADYAEAATLLPPEMIDGSLEHLQLHSREAGEQWVVHGYQVLGDGHEESRYLFAEDGRLLHFSHTTAGFGSRCGDIWRRVTVDYPPGEMATRRSLRVLNNGAPPDPELMGEDCVVSWADNKDDPAPNWGPRWLGYAELPAALR
jgi:hypothetical protein